MEDMKQTTSLCHRDMKLFHEKFMISLASGVLHNDEVKKLASCIDVYLVRQVKIETKDT